MGSPLTVDGIACWYRSKQGLLAGSGVSLVDVRERAGHLSAAAADFNGPNTMGRINGWVSGEFDFEAVRVSDGEDIYWRHVTVVSVDALESAYAEFLQSLLNAGGVAALPPSRNNQEEHNANGS